MQFWGAAERASENESYSIEPVSAATAAASKLLERDASISEALCLSAGADIF
jgi:hypothetical protein